MTKFKIQTIVAATFYVAFAADSALADGPVVDIKQAVHREGVRDDIGITRVIVDGAGTHRYDKVVNETLDFWVLVNGRKPDGAKEFLRLDLSTVSGIMSLNSPPDRDRLHKLTVPYVAPDSYSQASPVDRCNAELAQTSGAQRKAFLQVGRVLRGDIFYQIKATTYWIINSFTDPQTFVSTRPANAVIECRPLDRIRPRTETHTQGAPPRHGQKMQPTVQAVSFKAEPYQMETVAGQQCPTQIRLYGFVQVRRSFNGKLVFFGPHFLSPLTDLTFADAGQRTVTADYPVKWGNSGEKATTGLMAQLVLLKMNVANAEGKVLETVERGIQLSCKPTRTPPAN